MITEQGPKVLEYNVRFGDPETEALMLLLDDKTDLALVMLVSPARTSTTHLSTTTRADQSCLTFVSLQACVERRLDSVSLSYRQGYAISVILASGGYPGKYTVGKPITVGPLPKGQSTFPRP